MAEPAVVVFEDQLHRRRKLQLHNVDGLLRVNLTTALANYEAVSFSRAADGLILETLNDSEYSAQTFKPGEVVTIEAVRRNTDSLQAIVKAITEELDRRGVGSLSVDAIARGVVSELMARPDGIGQLLRQPFQDMGAGQSMQHDTPQPIGGQQLDLNQAGDGLTPHPQSAAGQLPMHHIAMSPAGAPSPQTSDPLLNASGKKRRFCGACKNHGVDTPVTFQHQQQCQWRNCPCNLCTKKRNISQAQAHKRHMAKQAAAHAIQVDSMRSEQEQQQEHQPAPAPPSPGQLPMPVPEPAA